MLRAYSVTPLYTQVMLQVQMSLSFCGQLASAEQASLAGYLGMRRLHSGPRGERVWQGAAVADDSRAHGRAGGKECRHVQLGHQRL